MALSIGHLTRKPLEGCHFSIESTAAAIREGLAGDKNLRIVPVVMPVYSKGIFPRLQLLFFVRRQLFDVYHVVGDIHFLVMGLPRRRLLVTIHDVLFLYPRSGIPWLLLWFFWVFLPAHRARRIVAVSHFTKGEIVRLTSCSARKIVVIPSLISQAFVPYPREFTVECPVILHLGAAWNKNLEGHVEALCGIQCHLVVVGKLSDRQQRLLVKSGISHEIHTALPVLEMPGLYRSCDLLLFSSLAEGFGLPILEAQATGRVVITSPGGATEETAGEGALYANPREPKEIRQAVLRLIADPGLREQLLAAGFRNLAKYNRNQIMEAHRRLYHQFIDL